MAYVKKANYKKVPQNYESSDKPSMTVQGEVNTIRDIMERHNREERERIYPKYAFFDNEELADIDKFFAPGALDFTDIDELNRRVDHMKELLNEGIEKAKMKERGDKLPDRNEPEPVKTEDVDE